MVNHGMRPDLENNNFCVKYICAVKGSNLQRSMTKEWNRHAAIRLGNREKIMGME